MSEEIITVKNLIERLMEFPMSDEVFIKNKEGKELHQVSICARKNDRVLEVLFG